MYTLFTYNADIKSFSYINILVLKLKMLIGSAQNCDVQSLTTEQ